MKNLLFVLFLTLIFSIGINAKCDLTEAPKLRNLYLGMEAKNFSYIAGEPVDWKIREKIYVYKKRHYSFTPEISSTITTEISPDKPSTGFKRPIYEVELKTMEGNIYRNFHAVENKNLDGVTSVKGEFYKNKLYELMFLYDDKKYKWKSREAFISAITEKLGLPSTGWTGWTKQLGEGVLILSCRGFEMAADKNYIRLTDTNAEMKKTAIAKMEQLKKEKENEKKAFKP